MGPNINAYTSALTGFYKAAAEWKFACNTDSKNSNELLKQLKRKALLLQEELKLLPADMQRPTVIEHINKVLKLANDN